MRFVRCCVAGVLFGCAGIQGAFASVNLNFSTTSTTVPRGSTFPLKVVLVSTTNNTSDKVSGVDYYLQASISNVFTIVSRNTATDGSAFATNQPSGDAAIANSPLNPYNGTDLGGSVANAVTTPVSGGTFTVADFVISVNPAAATGGYSITFPVYNPPGPASSSFSSSGFVDTAFTSLGTFNVTVTTPEPAVGMTIFGLAALGLCRRRRAAK